MSKARDLADFQGSASALTTGTLPVDRVPYVGRRNLIINGGFDVWQRSTDASATGGYYAPDRWQTTYSTNPIPLRLYRQNSNSSLMDSTYHLGISSSGVATNTGSNQRLRTKFEKSWGLNSDGSARPVTISFWMRSPQNNALQVYAESSSEMLVAQGNTNWQKFTHTFTGSAMGMVDFYLPNGEAIDVELSQVQLELGSVATPFEHRSYGEELALCQRYFFATELTTTWFQDNYLGAGHYGTQPIPFPTTMRSKPSVIADTVTNWVNSNISSVSILANNQESAQWRIRASSTGRTYQYYNANDGATFKFDAEL